MDARNEKRLLSNDELDKVVGGFGVIPDSEPNPIVIAEDNGPADVIVGQNDM